MLYLPCPKCGGKVTTGESTVVDRTLIQGKHALVTAGFAFPPLMLALTAFGVGNFIYRRVPGGGAKRCTNPKCLHQFN